MDESNKNLGRFIVFWQIVQFRLYEEIMNEGGANHPDWIPYNLCQNYILHTLCGKNNSHFYWKD